jgi:hypothetical protein
MNGSMPFITLKSALTASAWTNTITSPTGSGPSASRPTATQSLAKVKAGAALTEAEETELARRLNQPERYFNEDNLRRAYRNPGGNLGGLHPRRAGHAQDQEPRGARGG